MEEGHGDVRRSEPKEVSLPIYFGTRGGGGRFVVGLGFGLVWVFWLCGGFYFGLVFFFPPVVKNPWSSQVHYICE